ncbi:hypothetical protein [Variovorax sp. 770b2]|nr:hypothetical protein [Variovorax sp. 770b2]
MAQRITHDGGAEETTARLHAFALLRHGGADTRKYDDVSARKNESMIRRP